MTKRPTRAARSRDPLATASPLSAGYLMPGRQDGARRQRLAAFGVVAVLLVVSVLRFDASRIERDIADARGEGDCAQALAAVDRLWAGHHVVGAPVVDSGEDTVQACDRLRQASENLATGRTGDTNALTTGFGRLSTVLAELPGHEKMVDRALDGFRTGLPADHACDTKAITDWLGSRDTSGDALDRAADVVPDIAPAAIVECGDGYLATRDWEQARTQYRQLLAQYPDHALAAKAGQGERQATLEIELANVRALLTPPHSGAQPAYCTDPAPYSGAVRYGAKNPNRALLFGNAEYTSKVPAAWRALEAAEAVLVICAGDAVNGAAVRTCPYESKLAIVESKDVTFRKIAIPVRVYEVRTGKLVANTKVEINGASCPAILEYTTIGAIDTGPPSEVFVTPTDAQVRAAFSPLINR